jgi:glucose/arabinose dehydrogenase
MHRSLAAAFVAVTLVLGVAPLWAQNTGAAPKSGPGAFGDWREDAPGVRRMITAPDLPPIEKESPNGASVVAPPTGTRPTVAAGFVVEPVVSGIQQPRAMRVAPNGDLFVANSDADEILVFRIPSGSAKPVAREVFATGLNKPYGMAFYPLGSDPQWIYIANTDGVVRLPYRNGDLKSTGRAQVLVEHIPVGHHWTRDIAFAPDGKRFYLSVGSGSNVAEGMSKVPRADGGIAGWERSRALGASWDGEDRRALILSFDVDGKDETIVATGLRNASGITIEPKTGQLWAVVNERDNLGDNTPFEYATHVQPGAFYGWPWYYIGSHQDPRHAGERSDLKDKITIPDVLMQAHSAPLQIVFYEGENFPAEYRGDAFVTLHGSWDRSRRTGYKVVRLRFDPSGRATGEYDDFMTGLVVSDRAVWGRPVGVAVAKDGSLFVGEDGNGTIWRVSAVKRP